MPIDTLSVAIVGASGYMGEELVRILLGHPQVTVTSVTSRTYAGQRIGDVFPRYYEADLRFAEPDLDHIAATADVAMLALPHGVAAEFAVPLLDKDVRVIDLSADFRLDDAEVYRIYYGKEHPAPQLLVRSVYGLPERYREELKDAPLVACPGCYPSSIILAAAPLLEAGLAEPASICIASITGVSGAGRKLDVPYLFAECNESLRPYAVVGHRHTSELEQELAKAAGLESLRVNFVPHLAPVTRGIHSTIFLERTAAADSLDVVHACLMEAYADEPFVRVLPAGQVADTKHITMTNLCEIGCVLDERTGRIILSSAIDNLTKGGSGQGVQCMNIAAGFDEAAGLA